MGQVTAPLEPTGPPRVFAQALSHLQASLTDAQRPGVLTLREVPAPRRLAPYSAAYSAEVTVDGEDVATGRFVVLHDPAGQQGWRGDTRVVAFVSADVDAEMARDPALAEVGWSWLTQALRDRGAQHTAAGGTVTRTASLTFGLVENPEETNEVELRASWSPVHADDGTLDLAVHLHAWCDLLCLTAGLPPVGVTALRGRP